MASLGRTEKQQTWSSRGNKSRNKVLVCEPACGSLMVFWWRGVARQQPAGVFCESSGLCRLCVATLWRALADVVCSLTGRVICG